MPVVDSYIMITGFSHPLKTGYMSVDDAEKLRTELETAFDPEEELER